MTKKTFKAFHGDRDIKTKYLKRVMAHYKADEITQGMYWEGGHGCAVGCTIHGSEHTDYEKELGIPHAVARLEDAIFEALPPEQAKYLPVRFLKSIEPGADLSKVADKMSIEFLINKDFGLITETDDEEKKEILYKMANQLRLRINGKSFNAVAFAKLADKVGYISNSDELLNAIINNYEEYANRRDRDLLGKNFSNYSSYGFLESDLPSHITYWNSNSLDEKTAQKLSKKFLDIIKEESKPFKVKAPAKIAEQPKQEKEMILA